MTWDSRNSTAPAIVSKAERYSLSTDKHFSTAYRTYSSLKACTFGPICKIKKVTLGIRLETSNICEYNQERATSPSLYEELEPNQDNLDIQRKQLQDIGSMYVSKSIVHRTSNTSPGAVTGSEVVVGCFKVKFHGANQAPWSKTLF